MSDVGKGAAVHESGRALESLHEVGFHSVEQKSHYGARGSEFGAGKSGTVALDAQNQAINAGTQIVEVGSKAQHGHQFAGGGDVKACFRGSAVGAAAKAGHDVAQLTVVDVEHAAPCDFLEVDLTLMASIVDQSGDKVVGGRDGVEVAREVQVHGFHRQNLRVTAARSAALHAEDRAERGFAKRKHCLLAEAVESLSKSNRSRGLAGTGGHAGGGGDEDQLGVGLAFRVERELGLVPAVRFKLVVFKAPFMGKVVDTLQFGALSNFNVGKHRNVTPKG